MPHPLRADVVVIGLGGIGSAAFRALAERGRRVVGIERFAVGHDRGSSHGETRLFRARHAAPHRRALALAAMAGWNDLQARTGENLVRWTGQLWVGEPEVGAAAGLDQLSIREAAELGFCAPERDVHPFWDPSGGVLAVEACVAAQCRLGCIDGGLVLANTSTSRIERTNGAFRVHTSRGVVLAESVVLAMGAWTRRVLPQLPLTTYRVPQIWCPLDRDRPLVPFVFDLPSGDFYGAGWNAETVKVGGPRHGPLDDPMKRGRDVDGDTARRVAAFVRKHVPALRPEIVGTKWCMSTATPDGEFVVDRIAPGLIAAAGFCGRGFKYAPALGTMVADIVQGGAPLPQFSLRRARAHQGPSLHHQAQYRPSSPPTSRQTHDDSTTRL